jgi:tetratricopeptide (TPR) repeat protein
MEYRLTEQAFEVIEEAQNACRDLEQCSNNSGPGWSGSTGGQRLEVLELEAQLSRAECRCGPLLGPPDFTRYKHDHPAKWELAQEDLKGFSFQTMNMSEYHIFSVKCVCLRARIALHLNPDDREWESMLTKHTEVAEKFIEGEGDALAKDIPWKDDVPTLHAMVGLELSRAYVHVKKFDEATSCLEAILRHGDVPAARAEKESIEDAKEAEEAEQATQKLAKQIKNIEDKSHGKHSYARELLYFLKGLEDFSFCVKHVETSAVDEMDKEALGKALNKAFLLMHPDRHVEKKKLFKEQATEIAKNLSALKDALLAS